MAKTKKPFIHFKKESDFNTRLEAGDLSESSIVFIQDTAKIWTHNKIYSDSYTKAEIDFKLQNIAVIDNLASTDTKKPLSANQGRVLNEKIEEHTSNSNIHVTTADKTNWNNKVSFPGFAASGVTSSALAVRADDSRLSNSRPANGGNSDTVDGKHAGLTYSWESKEVTFPLVQFPKDDAPRENISPVSLRVWDSYNQEITGAGTGKYGVVLELMGRTSHWDNQLYFEAYGHNIWHRASGYNDTSWTYNWSKVAMTSDNVASATKLQTARSINGTNFDGTANITTSNWGTSRTITIGNSGKSVNGSANISWSLSEIGAAASSHTHNYAGSSSAGGAANSVKTSLILKVNSGTTEGTNLYTFNGSTAKTLDIKSGSNVTFSASAGVLTISSTNTTYSVATTSANGLMSSAMVTKLNGIATNANNYSHPTGNGNNHIPAGGSSGQILRWSAAGTAVWGADNNTTYSNFKAATASAAGGSGLVPAPAAGKQTSFLRGDGTWVIPTNTTYGLATTSANGLLRQLNGSTSNFMRGDGTWATPPNTTYGVVGANGSTGLVKNGSSVTSSSGYTACPIVSGVPYYKDTNTTYSVATTSANGLMSSAMVNNLNNLLTRMTAVENELSGVSAALTSLESAVK